MGKFISSGPLFHESPSLDRVEDAPPFRSAISLERFKSPRQNLNTTERKSPFEALELIGLKKFSRDWSAHC